VWISAGEAQRVARELALMTPAYLSVIEAARQLPAGSPRRRLLLDVAALLRAELRPGPVAGVRE
jgi:hypothetical protein